MNRQNIMGQTAIHQAYNQRDLDLFTRLVLNPKVDLHTLDINGESLFNMCCLNGDTEYAELLLGCERFDPNFSDREDRTALHAACLAENADLVKLILQRPQTDVNLKTVRGHTALHLACRTKNDEIVKLLLAEPKIDVNAPNQEMQGPIFEAMQPHNLSVLKLMIFDERINLHMLDQKGISPFQHAIQNGYEDAIHLFNVLELMHPEDYLMLSREFKNRFPDLQKRDFRIRAAKVLNVDHKRTPSRANAYRVIREVSISPDFSPFCGNN